MHRIVSALAVYLGASMAVGASLPATAQTCSKSSPMHTVALLELYTSEGCDSCPAADKFVSNIYKSTGLSADQLLPLSLHVDYWDYIGWKDIFAKPLFTQRQRWLAELASSRSVYTPEMFVAGQELRNWRGGVTEAVKRINQVPARADIRLSLDGLNERQLTVHLDSKTAHAGKLYFALVENNLVSQVQAGENRGVTLQHDYVVREWGEPVRMSSGGISVTRQLNIPPHAVRKNLAVAAFVQSDKGEVLQALSLPFCASL
ncbi:DUF1223 domain-containing protein [Undibacterium sp. Jales W-56]|uniref:DUF1223 domain-containing protein n=1 Tax=Undibacterium sp. Jales W-56 TaxID=2897325 RepID=UPI0021D024F1|nr:DUF1223 domain-containing protein [Undibacterium sp. Jales W-56]MCU6435607.1 DUF1223 domain-containing protein [Undibacterium sp. Jales W-56]